MFSVPVFVWNISEFNSSSEKTCPDFFTIPFSNKSLIVSKDNSFAIPFIVFGQTFPKYSLLKSFLSDFSNDKLSLSFIKLTKFSNHSGFSFNKSASFNISYIIFVEDVSFLNPCPWWSIVIIVFDPSFSIWSHLLLVSKTKICLFVLCSFCSIKGFASFGPEPLGTNTEKESRAYISSIFFLLKWLSRKRAAFVSKSKSKPILFSKPNSFWAFVWTIILSILLFLKIPAICFIFSDSFIMSFLFSWDFFSVSLFFLSVNAIIWSIV